MVGGLVADRLVEGLVAVRLVVGIVAVAEVAMVVGRELSDKQAIVLQHL
jgi:hypothetical protein